MKKDILLTNLHFHDSRVVDNIIDDNKLIITFENVLNLIDNSNLVNVVIEFVGFNIQRITKDYGGNKIKNMVTPILQDFIDILDRHPYVYELVELESISNYYEIFLSHGLDDGLPMIYFTFQDYRVDF